MAKWKLELTTLTLPLLAAAPFFGGLVWIGLYAIQYSNGFKTPQPLWYGIICCCLTIPFYIYAIRDNRNHNRPSPTIAPWKFAVALVISLALLWGFLSQTLNLRYDNPYLNTRKWYLQLGGAATLYVLILGVLSLNLTRE